MKQENKDESTGIQAEAKDGGTVYAAKELTVNNYSGERLKERGKPFQAPPLPSHFVDRPEISQDLKQRLIADSTTHSGTLVISAIQGLGGVGKTILAQALANDEDVQQKFPDGVLWATLGQQPNILKILTDWIINELGDGDYQPFEHDHASKHLRSLLADKTILLVIDDVWNPEHFDAFRVGGKNCQILVTTREARITEADRYDLDIMTQKQALNLIVKITHKNSQVSNSQSEFKLSQSELEKIQSFAEIVGYLPLALELGATQIVDGLSWDDLIEDLKGEIADLEALNLLEADEISSESKRKKYSLIASFNLSFKRLAREKLEKFAWLGVLPEDVTITQEMVSTLWGFKPRKARDLLRTLRAKALLLDGVPYNNKPTYRLHDLVHDFARNLLVAPTVPEKQGNLPGLGLTLKEAHEKLLQQYQNQTRDRLWHSLNDDGYIHEHLTWHMEQGGCIDSIHQLLWEETESGKNGWHSKCESLGKTAIFVGDVARAWKWAESEYETNPTRAIGLQCRYALITSSLNTMAGNIPPELIAALVEKKVWTTAQGLAYSRQVQSLPQRAEALSKLASYLPEIWLEALEAARNISSEYLRADVLSAIAPHLPEIWLEALEAARNISFESDRANVLSAIAPHLPENLLPKALEAARNISFESDRANVLSAIAPHLPEIWSEALEAARNISDEHLRANVLRDITPHLPENLLPKALEAVRNISDEYLRANVLRDIAPHLPENLLPKALEAARNISDEPQRARVLRDITLHLPENLLPKALAAARNISSRSQQARVLSAIAPHLPEIWSEALEAARNISSERDRANVLRDIAPHLPENLLPKALEAARNISDELQRANVLRDIAPHLPEFSSEAHYAAA